MATPWLRAARRTSSLVDSKAVGTGAARTSARQHPLGEVVDGLELRVAAGDGQVADEEEVVERLARLRPVPAPVDLLARSAVVELAGRGGAAVAHLVVHPVDHPRLVFSQAPQRGLSRNPPSGAASPATARPA